MSVTQNKQLISEFLEEVWNQKNFSNLDRYLATDFVDHSFARGLPPTREGLIAWISGISASFEHHTSIESALGEGDLVMLRICFRVKHTGEWRGLAPTGRTAEAKGFRQFRLQEGKIAEHWALLDGEQLQARLTEVPTGCAIPSVQPLTLHSS